MEKIDQWTQKYLFFNLIVSGLSIAGMMLLIVVDVTMRNLFNSPISGTYEIVQYFIMPLAVFPGLAYTYKSGVLPRLTELALKTPEKYQVFNKYLIVLIEIVIFALLTIYGFKFALTGIAERMSIPVSGSLLPVYPIYLLVPISFATVLWVVVFYVIYDYKSKKKEVGV